MLFITDFLQYNQNVETIPYSQFLSYVDEDKVASVSIGADRIQGTLKEPLPGKKIKEFAAIKVEDPGLASGLYESKFWQGILAWMIPIILLFFLFTFLMRRMAGGAGTPRGGGFLSMGKSKAKIYVEKGLKVRFDDVAGVDVLRIRKSSVEMSSFHHHRVSSAACVKR